MAHKKGCKLLPKISGLKEYPGGGTTMKGFTFKDGGSTLPDANGDGKTSYGDVITLRINSGKKSK